jgi:hypothetical protein
LAKSAGKAKMKKLEIVRTCSLEGEIHFILQDTEVDRSYEKCRFIDKAEVKEITKKQAAKPLLLLREE